MDPKQKAVLYKLSSHPLTTIDMTDEEIRAIRQLLRKNLARDYADFYRRRTPTHLRIWGITSAGKAILNETSQSHTFTRRTQLDFGLATIELKEPTKSPIRVRIRSPQPPALIPRYRFNRDKNKENLNDPMDRPKKG